MEAGRGIEHAVPGLQLDFVRTVAVLDHKFATVILFRLGQEQCDREVCADAKAGQAVAADGIVDV